MQDVLTRICAKKHAEVAQRRAAVPEPDTSAARPPRLFHVEAAGFAVVAEVKRASPSAGEIAAGADAVAQARTYEAAGAAAVSVLTDAEHFGGSLEDLADVAAAVSVPVLRKDFIVDAYQVAEARAAGADLVLLIAAALEPNDLARLAMEVRAHDMTPLVEVHTAAEIDAAASAVAAGGILGVNARNLETLDVDLSVWENVAAALPQQVTAIAESGVKAPADAARAAAAGYAGVLCGEALMRAADPVTFITEMREAALAVAR
jgi:indole-3-glycerol phosphate synthase